ncbi:MAG TPA: TrpB-like pyridoxal phosphate-dependent enzyme [Bacteroidota bacterium]|nr:TrpB-like pyridoxal phosphate-dependent enzyme [Bacteroidota bacterium]
MQRKFMLDENEIPTEYYNIMADLPNPMEPPLHPATKQPVGPQDLSPIFPMELIKQEVSSERSIPIPDEVRSAYAMYRPTPLFRAYELERALDTPAHIYYKYEGGSPAGSHKLNTALAQAYYNKQEGVKRLATETGAGQWGSSLALACQRFGLKCKVYMVKVSFEQKPYRKSMIQTWGSEVIASPSMETKAGRDVLAKDPNSTGSLGIAISEAVEDAVQREDTKYALGSVLNHVVIHQSIIGLEAKKQMEKAGEYPDIVIGCVGGGSNFGGIAAPFVKDKIEGKKIRAIAVEPATCPTLTKGEYRYDLGDEAGMTPLLAMYTLGHDFMPPSIHAGGLRYHGMSPIVSRLYLDKLIEAQAYEQTDVFEAAVLFARTEGIVPAPESSHAIKSAIEEAKNAKAEGSKKVILFNLSGHGHFDMSAYDAYFAGKLNGNGKK